MSPATDGFLIYLDNQRPSRLRISVLARLGPVPAAVCDTVSASSCCRVVREELSHDGSLPSREPRVGIRTETELRVAAGARHSRRARLTLAGDDLHLAEAPCYRGRQLDGARIDHGGRPEIRNVAEADPRFGIGTPHRPSVARVAE